MMTGCGVHVFPRSGRCRALIRSGGDLETSYPDGRPRRAEVGWPGWVWMLAS